MRDKEAQLIWEAYIVDKDNTDWESGGDHWGEVGDHEFYIANVQKAAQSLPTEPTSPDEFKPKINDQSTVDKHAAVMKAGDWNWDKEPILAQKPWTDDKGKQQPPSAMDGNHRVAAAQQAGVSEIKVKWVDELLDQIIKQGDKNTVRPIKEAYVNDPLSGSWSIDIDGKQYTGSVQDLINNTQHIQEVDWPVAQLEEFSMWEFTDAEHLLRDLGLSDYPVTRRLAIPKDREGATQNINGKWIKYNDLTPRQQLDYSSDETARLDRADMNHPIYVAVDSRNAPVGVIDGNHRLSKAVRDKHSTIKTKFVGKGIL